MLHFRFYVLERGHGVCDMLPKQLAVAFLEPVDHDTHAAFGAFEFCGEFAIR